MPLFGRGNKQLQNTRSRKKVVEDCVDEIQNTHREILSNSKKKEEKRWKDDVLSPWVLDRVCDEKERYDDPLDKASYLMTTIATEHPFFDGNKRTSYVTAIKYLEKEGYSLKSSKKDCKFIKEVAAGTKTQSDVKKWLKKKTK